MAGYNYTSWKSNAAEEAEAAGLLKAGQLAQRLGVTTAAVRACCFPQEWHHVGGGYARVDYYGAIVDDYTVAKCRAYDTARRPCSWPACSVSWLVWPKFKVGRWAKNAGRPTLVAHEGAQVTRLTPNTYQITLPAGRVVTKRATTRGLRIAAADQVVVDNTGAGGD